MKWDIGMTLMIRLIRQWNISDIDGELVPVRSIGGKSEPYSIPVLVETDAPDLYYLDMPVYGEVEVCSLDMVRRPPFDFITVPALQNAEFRHVGDCSLRDIARIKQPGSAI